MKVFRYLGIIFLVGFIAFIYGTPVGAHEAELHEEDIVINPHTITLEDLDENPVTIEVTLSNNSMYDKFFMLTDPGFGGYIIGKYDFQFEGSTPMVFIESDSNLLYVEDGSEIKFNLIISAPKIKPLGNTNVYRADIKVVETDSSGSIIKADDLPKMTLDVVYSKDYYNKFATTRLTTEEIAQAQSDVINNNKYIFVLIPSCLCFSALALLVFVKFKNQL